MIFPTLCFVAGVIILQQMARLPDLEWSVPALLAASVLFRYPKCRPATWLLLGWTWAFAAGVLTLQDRLSPAFEGKDLLVEGRIIGIPQAFEHGYRFGFKIDSIDGFRDETFSGKVRLSWYSHGLKLRAGDRWRIRVRLKQPHGNLNPGGFDYEQWLYLQGYGATGYVRQSSETRRLPDSAANLSVDRSRQSVAERLSIVFKASQAGGIIQALVIGEQGGITEQQWEVFRKTGTAHLVAISGLHIALVAGLALVVAKWLWIRTGGLRVPAPSVGAGSAILSAAGYSALAGFSLPTQRSLIMISLVMGGILLRRNIAPGHTLAIALLLIVLVDPLAVLSASLWLSFSAVWIITYILAGRIGKTGRWATVRSVHIATAAGLAPLLLIYFQQVSLIAPLANLVAVPVVSLLVVPCCLLGTILMLIVPKAGIALLAASGFVLDLLWPYLEWLSELPFAQWPGQAPSFLTMVLAITGLLLLFAPRGVPARWLGAPMLLPMFFAPVNSPDPGEFRFTLLDVGQGLAAVVETANHTLVFDTGARFSDRLDMGSAVVAPFLRSRDIDSIDRLVISHGDNDHLGGALSLNKLIDIEKIYSSPGNSIDWKPVIECQAGQNWVWDGIEFRMLAPLAGHFEQENDNSCVLKVTSRSNSILLTGDIEKQAERALVERYGTLLASDYLVVPHHGSNTSSTFDFLRAVHPRYALVPAGYRNRYGFPRPQAVERLERAGAEIYNTADSGAILFSSGTPNTPAVPLSYRTESAKYYHFRALNARTAE
ncbi:MAG: DNA internalization-related competence protein ComEC/Rec2 [Methylococcales bacterium]